MSLNRRGFLLRLCINVVPAVLYVLCSITGTNAQALVHSTSFGGYANDVCTGGVETADGAFLIYGYTASIDGDFAGVAGAIGNNGFVTKVDTSGNLVWVKATAADAVVKVAEAPGNQYAVLTASTSGCGAAFFPQQRVIRLDAQGNLVNSFCLDFPYCVKFVDIMPADNGGLYLLATTNDCQIDSGETRIVHVDSVGNISSYHDFPTAYGNFPRKFIRSWNDNFVVLATRRGPFLNHTAWVFEADTSGNVIWEEYGYNSMTMGLVQCDIIRADSGHYIFVTQGSSSKIFKIDTAGGVVWQKAIPVSGDHSGLYSLDGALTLAGDNILVTIGAAPHSDEHLLAYWETDSWVLCLDSSGNSIWEKSYGNANYNHSNFIAWRNGTIYTAGRSAADSINYLDIRNFHTANGIANEDVNFFKIKPGATVFGNLFGDADGNGYNVGEHPVFEANVRCINGTDTFSVLTDHNGWFRLDLPLGTYELVAEAYDMNPYATVVTLNTLYARDTFYVPLTPNPILSDAAVFVYRTPQNSPNETFNIRFWNLGQTVSGTLKLLKHAGVSVAPDVPPDVVIADTLVWEFADLKPYEVRDIGFTTNSAGTSTVDSGGAYFRAWISAAPSEMNPADNYFVLRSLVTAGIALPEGNRIDLDSVLAGKYITLSHQLTRNLSTWGYPADLFNYVQLDARLDLASFHPLDAAYGYELVQRENFRKWLLRDVPSSGPILSARVLYRVKPRTDVQPGDSIVFLMRRNDGGPVPDTAVVVICPGYHIYQDHVICEGDSVWIGNAWRKAPGIYDTWHPDVFGCDSIVHHTVTLDSVTEVQHVLCNGEGLFLNGSWHYAPGIYFENLAAGCDSAVKHVVTNATADYDVVVQTNQLVAAQQSASYQWLDCSTYLPVPGAADRTFTPLYDGSFAVIVWYNGCMDTSACNVFIVDVPVIAPVTLRLFPNPANWNIRVVSDAAIPRLVIQVYDATGRLLKWVDCGTTAAAEVELDDLAAGVYGVVLSDGDTHLFHSRVAVVR